MKFSCTQENLNQGLSVVSHIAGKNINLPILGNVLVQSGENRILRFMTTNLEIAINCTVRGKVEEPGEFTIPSRLFSDYVSLLPKERVDVVQEDNSVTVSCGTYQTKMNGIPASEFPLIPSVERKQRFRLKVGNFRRSVGQVLFAVAPNESRPEISGVLFRFTSGKGNPRLVLAATDSYRLAEKSIPLSAEGFAGIGDDLTVIVPSRTVSEVVRILGLFRDGIGLDENLEIGMGDNQVVFSYDNVEITSRVIEGRYPDYRQLIPESCETDSVIRKDDLQRAVKTASLFSKVGLNDVRLEFNQDRGIHLSSVNSQTGEHAVDLEGKVKGKDNGVTLNFKYFLDGIGNIESDTVAVQMVDGNSPVVIRPVSESGDVSDDYLYIIMPIRQ
ncbi:DNA polymerase III subunit beta [Candidatus Uhrbacteria bacterium]|nr:DNA polymerase III subunit beta [Candidatus Uhrbacteria bacterium]